ncbi:hypothetical protein [Natranaerofaba carboxydovora]|uniref:hypothetical protein n=1 Tax=Natranaerofaba carboxydovora TaxID=2742683 RepID=UPI001F12C4F0|nr:hypothetical protein [Natranaerofaba carboxydovora]UMZ74469.1 hypothetical protein ACONDI_02061 [Natranaerofaba carboxydovora]
MGRLYGKVGGKSKGYYIESEISSDELEIKGNLGGKLQGHDIDLNLSSELTEISGRLGRDNLEKNLKLSLHKEGPKNNIYYDIIGKLNEKASYCDVSLEGSITEGFSGRIGEEVGYNVELKVFKNDGKITGRLGGKIVGANVDINYEYFPPVLGIIIISLTYSLYLENHGKSKH